MSPSRLRVNSTLPAPTSTIRVIERPPRRWRRRAEDVAQALAVVALDPVGAIGVVAPQPGEREGEERDRRHGVQRRVVLGRVRGQREQDGRRRPAAPARPRSSGRPSRRRGAARSAMALARRPVRRERDDDGIGPEHRRGAGGHLPDLGALGVDEGHLLELERRLEGGRVAEPAARDEQVARVDEGRGEGLDQGLRGGDGGLGGVRARRGSGGAPSWPARDRAARGAAAPSRRASPRRSSS